MRKANCMYSHKEIAVLYFPHILPKSASRQLGLWIQRDEELLKELLELGYHIGQRVFSPIQIQALIRHLGDPDDLMAIP